jgi:hypothetical protein
LFSKTRDGSSIVRAERESVFMMMVRKSVTKKNVCVFFIILGNALNGGERFLHVCISLFFLFGMLYVGFVLQVSALKSREMNLWRRKWWWWLRRGGVCERGLKKGSYSKSNS